VAGRDVAREPAEVRRRCGVVFQSQSLDRHLTVEENLRAQGHLHGLAGAALRDRMREAVERLGLADRLRDLVAALSGGLKRRVEIAKALLHRPEVLLMDEASTGLDPGARRELWRYVDELRGAHGVTILLTTHVLDEADRCDRLALLHLGRIVAAGRPAELKARIGGDVVVLETGDPGALAPRIAARFGAAPAVVNGELRVEIANGHRFITEVVEAFPGAIDSVGLHKPTLEDVFVHETGARIE
jgi:ABC-2 type transport system ATP-binding protein